MKWYLEVLKKYAVFSGRARRKEFWMFWLFNFIIAFGLAFIEGISGIAAETDTSVLATVYFLAILIPHWAVTVRRLHDTGRSGWWILIGFVPLIGGIVLIVLLALDSEPGENRYGLNPKTEVAD